jgi:hypothetical protein
MLMRNMLYQFSNNIVWSVGVDSEWFFSHQRSQLKSITIRLHTDHKNWLVESERLLAAGEAERYTDEVKIK